MKQASALGGAIACAASVLALGSALAPANSQPSSDAAIDMARPGDAHRWVAVGATVRLDRESDAPWQLRQVLMAPDDYERFLETGAFADGTRFAVVFYPVARDDTHQPPLYHARAEMAFAMEVIDPAHPDGRRFYVFDADGARAAPLPAGNECAVCHNTRGSFDGTFARMYPLLARRLPENPPP